MQTSDLNRLDFIVYCIETYKAHKNLDGSSVYTLFQNTCALKYIDDCYDALHTFGDEEIVRNIDEFLDGAGRNIDVSR